MARKNQKNAILDAAEAVIGRNGLMHTTLDAVAVETGISKGGLLYHFSSKKDLIFQLIERHNLRLLARKDEIRETLPEGPGRDLKAYILAKLNDPSRKNMSASKMVGIIEDDDLRGYVAKIKMREFQEIEKSCKHPEQVAILLLAMEGLWMMDLFSVSEFTPEYRRKIISTLLEQIDKACLCAG